MGFGQKEAEDLLAATGRRCCLCGHLHGVQLHHIVPTEENGTDDIDNAIALCPNCHDEVHTHRVKGHGVSYRIPRRIRRGLPRSKWPKAKVNCSKCGQAVEDNGFVGDGIAYCHACHVKVHQEGTPRTTTRKYTARELRLHRERIIETVAKERAYRHGTDAWDDDRELILFYSQCLDRPAFRTRFHEELSFSDFDRAMEDTLLALNTGYWRTRDDVLIERSRGKSNVVNPDWRRKLDTICKTVEEIRKRFREAVGFNDMLYFRRMRQLDPLWDSQEARFRDDRELGNWMDEKRSEAIQLFNTILREIDLSGLEGIR